MKRVLLSAVAFVAMTSAALAEPRKLADAELGEVTAGLYDLVFIVPVTVIFSDVNSSAVGVNASNAASNAQSNVAVNNIIGVDQSDYLIGTSAPAQAALLGLGGGWWPWAEPRSGVTGGGVEPMRTWSMIADMLRSRYLGRGW